MTHHAGRHNHAVATMAMLAGALDELGGKGSDGGGSRAKRE